MGVVYSVLMSASIVMGVLTAIPYDSIDKAFDSGNAEKIVALGKDKILINIQGKEAAYGHSQAIMVLKSFFKSNPPNGFSFSFKGKESGEGSFAIGTYKSGSSSYRVTIHFKKNGNELSIESLSRE